MSEAAINVWLGIGTIVGILFIWILVQWHRMPPIPKPPKPPTPEAKVSRGGRDRVPYATDYPPTKNEIFEQIMAEAEAERKKEQAIRQEFWDRRSRAFGESAGYQFDCMLDAEIARRKGLKNKRFTPSAGEDTVDGEWTEK